MHLWVYNVDYLLAELDFDSDDKTVSNYKFYTNNLVWRPFGTNTAPDYGQFLAFLEKRCPPRGRFDINKQLSTIGLSEYDPLEIAKRTHGVQFHDYIWLKFSCDDPNLTYDTIRAEQNK